MIFTSFEGHMYSSVHEFTIIKYFDIKCQSPPAPRIVQINWWFPTHNWIKYNQMEFQEEISVYQLVVTYLWIFRKILGSDWNHACYPSININIDGIMLAIYVDKKKFFGLKLT